MMSAGPVLATRTDAAQHSYFWTSNGYQLIYATGLPSTSYWFSFVFWRLVPLYHCILHIGSYTLIIVFISQYPACKTKLKLPQWFTFGEANVTDLALFYSRVILVCKLMEDRQMLRSSDFMHERAFSILLQISGSFRVHLCSLQEGIQRSRQPQRHGRVQIPFTVRIVNLWSFMEQSARECHFSQHCKM